MTPEHLVIVIYPDTLMVPNRTIYYENTLQRQAMGLRNIQLQRLQLCIAPEYLMVLNWGVKSHCHLSVTVTMKDVTQTILVLSHIESSSIQQYFAEDFQAYVTYFT